MTGSTSGSAPARLRPETIHPGRVIRRPPPAGHADQMDDFSLLDMFLTLLWFFLFIAWIYLLVMLATDIFRSQDLEGWKKALWILLLIVLPVLGSLAYLIVRGEGMVRRQGEAAARQESAFRSYVQNAAGTPRSPADEIEKLARLRDSGSITDAEFETQKAKLLA